MYSEILITSETLILLEEKRPELDRRTVGEQREDGRMPLMIPDALREALDKRILKVGGTHDQALRAVLEEL